MQQTLTQNEPRQQAHHWAPVLRALADVNRLHIALLLSREELSVRELQERTGLSQALVSHHLRPLREQSLVRVRVQGRSNHYSICCDEVAALITTISDTTQLPRC